MQVTSDKWQVTGTGSRMVSRVTRRPSRVTRAAFTLIEVLVVVTLLALIVVALMGVFTATQKAFRASMTQTDVLEGGRAAMDLITGDLKAMSPSLDYSNGAVNLFVSAPNASPLFQPLNASPDNQSRTNLLQIFFILSRENQTWTGTGYVVDPTSTNGINPLYRFSMNTNVAVNPLVLYNTFLTNVNSGVFTNMSRLLDGVITLRLRAYDNNGYWMTGNYGFGGGQAATNYNAQFFPPFWGETGFFMFSNTLPPVVEIEMATLEDRTLLRAESRPNNLPGPPPNDSRTLYLNAQAANVHVFRQRVSVPNANAYQ